MKPLEREISRQTAETIFGLTFSFLCVGVISSLSNPTVQSLRFPYIVEVTEYFFTHNYWNIVAEFELVGFMIGISYYLFENPSQSGV